MDANFLKNNSKDISEYYVFLQRSLRNYRKMKNSYSFLKEISFFSFRKRALYRRKIRANDKASVKNLKIFMETQKRITNKILYPTEKI